VHFVKYFVAGFLRILAILTKVFMDGSDAPVSKRERVFCLGWYGWRTQLQPIRTATEITAHIKILPARQPYSYQKLSQKATQLRLLGMTYEQIAKNLNINRKTATKACEYQGR